MVLRMLNILWLGVVVEEEVVEVLEEELEDLELLLGLLLLRRHIP